MSALRDFTVFAETLAPGRPNGQSTMPVHGDVLSAAPSPTGAGDSPPQAGKTPAKTDDSRLGISKTVLIKDKDGNTVAFEEPDVEYWFEVEVANDSKLPTSPLFVRFEIKELNWSGEFPENDGLELDPQQQAPFSVKYGTIPLDTDVILSACVYSRSAPDKALTCAGTANIMVKHW